MSLEHFNRLRTALTVSSFPPSAFLSDVSVYDVDASGELVGCVGSPIEHLARAAVESGSSEITTRAEWLSSESVASIAIPVHRGGHVVSVATLSARRSNDIHEEQDDLVGVFEVWEPIGVYEEVALKLGFYGRMERFQNVSSFVRFEKGNGLPGLVWQDRCAVIHDDLGNHPGFLRAAGASADLLVTAIGIPVASTAFHGVAVLIGSNASPLARGFEVWHADRGGFCLLGGAYRNLPSPYCLNPGTLLDGREGLPGLAASRGGAVLCTSSEVLRCGMPSDSADATSKSASAPSISLAIPFYEGESLTSVATLLF